VNLFWLIALAQAMLIAGFLFCGRIRIRRWLLAERETEPKRFWFCLAVFVVGLLVVSVQAIHPPY
jgi:4-amino-4-deoxy-L-arabinose transferase-like glycosyltransferase